jgi:hypothetical protein
MAQYWEGSRRLRDAFSRHVLADLLEIAYSEIDTMRDDELRRLVAQLQQHLREVEPGWALTPGHESRAELRRALETIRADAAVASAPKSYRLSAEPGVYTLTGLAVGLAVDRASDRVAVRLQGRLAHGVVWIATRLLAAVDRRLVRRCAFEGCARYYVGGRNQKFCRLHQAEAHRQTQRRAEQAFRARQRTATKKGTR